MSNNDRELRGRIAELEKRFPQAPPENPPGVVTEAPQDGVDYVRVDAQWRAAAYFSGLWGDLGGVPSTFPPSAHTHVLANIIDAGTLAGFDDAPSDGNDYARNNGRWVLVSGGGFPDAPSDGNDYVRRDANWEIANYFPDAPSDGKEYVRLNGGWAINTGGSAMPDAPSDGNDYLRRDGTWVVANYFSGAWRDLTGVPSAFPPDSHTHALADITDAGTLAAEDFPAASNGFFLRDDGTWAPPETRMNWRGTWSPLTYYEQDVVYQNGYAMVANKETTDQAAPTEVGLPEYTLPDAPMWQSVQQAARISSGHLYAFTTMAEVRGFRVWIPAVGPSIEYILTFVRDGATTQKVILNPVIGWNLVPITSTLFTPGAQVLAYLESENSSGNTIITGGWQRGSNNNNREPDNQQWNTNVQQNVLRIDFNDADSANRQAQLESIIAGSTIDFVETASPENFVTFRVTGNPTTGATSVIYPVQVTNTGAGTPSTGDLTTMTADVPVAQQTEFVGIADGWAGNQPTFAEVTSYLAFDGVDQGASLNNQYGLDPLVQELNASPDWDFLSAVGSGGGGGGGSFTPDIFEGPGTTGYVPDPVTGGKRYLDADANWGPIDYDDIANTPDIPTDSFWEGSLTGNISNANSGNVGMGTSSPVRQAHVVSTSNFVMRLQSSNDYSLIEFQQGANNISVGSNRGDFQIRIANVGQMLIKQGAPADSIHVDASGNVGLGVTSQAQRLHVDGGARLEDGAVEIRSPTNTPQSLIRTVDASGASVGQLSAHDFDGAGASTEWRFDSTIKSVLFQQAVLFEPLQGNGTRNVVVDSTGQIAAGPSVSGSEPWTPIGSLKYRIVWENNVNAINRAAFNLASSNATTIIRLGGESIGTDGADSGAGSTATRLANVVPGDQLRVASAEDPSRYALYNITAITDGGVDGKNYIVERTEGAGLNSGSVPDGEQVIVDFVPRQQSGESGTVNCVIRSSGNANRGSFTAYWGRTGSVVFLSGIGNASGTWTEIEIQSPPWMMRTNTRGAFTVSGTSRANGSGTYGPVRAAVYDVDNRVKFNNSFNAGGDDHYQSGPCSVQGSLYVE